LTIFVNIGDNMTRIVRNELEIVGQTPILHLNNLLGLDDTYADIYVDLLHRNPTGSHKVLAYDTMISSIEQERGIDASTILVEYSTGNAATAAAFVCAQKGYDLVVFMPGDMSQEKKQQLVAYGATVILTPADQFIVGAKQAAVAYVEQDLDSRVLLDQSSNTNNPKGYRQVGRKLIDTLPRIDAFVCGGGTYGTITGITEVLKEHDPSIKVTCVEAVYAAHIHAQRRREIVIFTPHKLIGFGAELLAPNARPELYDHIVTVDEETAVAMMKTLHRKGLFIGKTTGGNVHHALQVAKKLGPGNVVATVTYDSFFKMISEQVYATV
jgi:cysteine synthase